MEFEGAAKVTGSSFASVTLPQVRVFNRDFVNATLSQTSGIAPNYFLGKDSVEKQAQVDELQKKLAAITTDVATMETTKKNAEKDLDDFCVGKSKLIKELLTTANSLSYNNYDKRNFRCAVEALDVQGAAAGILSDEEKARFRSQKDAQPKPKITKVAAPSIDLDALVLEVGALVNRSVVAQTLDELTRNSRLAAWVQEGLGCTREYTPRTLAASVSSLFKPRAAPPLKPISTTPSRSSTPAKKVTRRAQFFSLY